MTINLMALLLVNEFAACVLRYTLGDNHDEPMNLSSQKFYQFISSAGHVEQQHLLTGG